ncbi:hypothetical protein [Catenibacterium sp.]|uniref:hypothetical protein n=1 Tax=Catenibacterium sp. TaxID=2049022 RepID=UPI0039913CD8
MSENKVIDKQFKLDAVQYRKHHPELTFQQVADNLGVSIVQSIDGANSLMMQRVKMKIVIYSEDQVIIPVMMQKNWQDLKKKTEILRDAVEILKKAMNILKQPVNSTL